MHNTSRNVDTAYYGSRKPLNLRGTREGSKRPAAIPSYLHRSGDMAASSDQYYATLKPVAQPVIAKAPVPKVVSITLDSTPILHRVVTEFTKGATQLQISGSDAQVRDARSAVDMSVGMSVLTRAQADAVTFIIKPSVMTEEDTIMPLPPKSKSKPKAKVKAKKKTKSSASNDEITEADVAAAFGVVEEGDD